MAHRKRITLLCNIFFVQKNLFYSIHSTTVVTDFKINFSKLFYLIGVTVFTSRTHFAENKSFQGKFGDISLLEGITLTILIFQDFYFRSSS